MTIRIEIEAHSGAILEDHMKALGFVRNPQKGKTPDFVKIPDAIAESIATIPDAPENETSDKEEYPKVFYGLIYTVNTETGELGLHKKGSPVPDDFEEMKEAGQIRIIKKAEYVKLQEKVKAEQEEDQSKIEELVDDAPEVSIDEIRSIAREAMKVAPKGEMGVIFGRHDATKLSEVDPSKYAALKNDLEYVIESAAKGN